MLRAAASASPKRVVVTSSTEAVIGWYTRDGSKTFDERDWTNLGAPGETVSAYEQSKTLAERAAWALAESARSNSSPFFLARSWGRCSSG